MIPEKLKSRKLIVTVLAVALVATSDLLGLNLTDESLGAIVSMVLGLVGGQALVDVAEAVRSGKQLAEGVEDVKDSTDE